MQSVFDRYREPKIPETDTDLPMDIFIHAYVLNSHKEDKTPRHKKYL